jgi:hypothetical protein
MGVMRVLLVVLVAACWRGGATTEGHEPRSFVARVTGLSELQRGTEAVHAELATALHRILRLATEEQRTAIRDDLRALAHETTQLAARARAARACGDDPAVLDRVERRLSQATVTLAQLHDGLYYARTLAELEELERANDEPEPLAYSRVMFAAPTPTLRWRRAPFVHAP